MTARSVQGGSHHPKGLSFIFLIEMWERFSYYGMRALLILYLVGQIGFDDRNAYLIYGSYTSLVYVTPLIGGLIADRLIGYRNAIILGGLLITTGHLLLALENEGLWPHSDHAPFFAALAFIVVGTGFLKPNCLALLNSLYDRDDALRDSGFTIFYLGINVGAALGALIAGWLGETWGWSWGFGAAGLGMIIGLVQFLCGTRAFDGHGTPSSPRWQSHGRRWLALTVTGALLGIPVASWLITDGIIVQYVLGASGFAVALFILWTAWRQDDSRASTGMLAGGGLILVSVLFWALYEQAGSSLNLFTERRLDREFLGYAIPASMFQALNSIYILFMAPVLAKLWTVLSRTGREPGIAMKFALGLALLGGGFLVLVQGIAASGEALVPMVYMLLLYGLHTLGELCLVPPGISSVARMSLARVVGFMMGAWAFANAVGSYLAGIIATATTDTQGGVDGISQVYTTIGLAAVAAAAAMAVLDRLLRKIRVP